MKKDLLTKILEKVAVAKKIANAEIEYNVEALPRHKEIKNNNFFGIKATFNNRVEKDGVNVIYKM